MSDLKVPENLRQKIPCQKCGHNFIIEGLLKQKNLTFKIYDSEKSSSNCKKTHKKI